MNMQTPISPEHATPYELGARDGASPRRSRLWLIVALVIIAALVATWALFGRAKPPVAEAPKLPQVTVVVPGASAVADEVRVTGSIAARRDMPVGVQGEGGLVTRVLVDAGQFVRRGQVLASIDRSVQVQQVAAMAAGIRTARADAALAQAELDRAAKLVSKGFISKADIDRKTATRDANLARVSVAQAQLGEMQARVARLDVRAPAAGLVLARSVEAGQVVGAGGAPLFRIAEGGVLEMRAQVAEQDMARLKTGLPASVRPVGSTTDYRGRIWLLDPVIDVASRQGIARIALAYSPGLRVGAFANASIAAGETTQPLLPQSAIQVDGEGSYVYVVNADNTVARRPIVQGRVSDTGVGITRGLSGNEKVVVSAGAFLKPGEKVVPVAAARAR
ncbi:efflux RND transporter periplasmic adaptor subunit [Glacieibacterium frigidum]|uniref:Efflux RND transporter periplasmic adaptor subunit n=1 Tax=Glacieibacterium frigidum TaxID=2593303 RepID=A0A552UIN8_9SPHN|nr:efflux RND transporter periplasmic adaptor subunit [Glacieibacterium frigidum]TRW18096.1 efflux RND transporter periplasmic adaptor subunit [Glacieibacterium frigidum]